MAVSNDAVDDGKTWGLWLWYLKDGSKSDAESRWGEKQKAWPYMWFKTLPINNALVFKVESVLAMGGQLQALQFSWRTTISPILRL